MKQNSRNKKYLKLNGRNVSKDENLFKTEICKNFELTGNCQFGERCKFAHGTAELRYIIKHNHFRTQDCSSFHDNYVCYYGKRCDFSHEKIAASLSNSSFYRLPCFEDYCNAEPGVYPSGYNNLDSFEDGFTSSFSLEDYSHSYSSPPPVLLESENSGTTSLPDHDVSNVCSSNIPSSLPSPSTTPSSIVSCSSSSLSSNTTFSDPPSLESPSPLFQSLHGFSTPETSLNTSSFPSQFSASSSPFVSSYSSLSSDISSAYLLPSSDVFDNDLYPPSFSLPAPSHSSLDLSPACSSDSSNLFSSPSSVSFTLASAKIAFSSPHFCNDYDYHNSNNNINKLNHNDISDNGMTNNNRYNTPTHTSKANITFNSSLSSISTGCIHAEPFAYSACAQSFISSTSSFPFSSPNSPSCFFTYSFPSSCSSSTSCLPLNFSSFTLSQSGTSLSALPIDTATTLVK